MQLELYQIDAFTARVFGGNPACVVPLNEWLPEATLLQIAQENAVGLELLHLGGGGLRRHHRDLATALAEHAQDVLLYAKVIGHDMEFRSSLLAIALAQNPLRFRPGVAVAGADHPGQIKTGH